MIKVSAREMPIFVPVPAEAGGTVVVGTVEGGGGWAIADLVAGGAASEVVVVGLG
jgi:hypothetical protein